MTPDRIKIEKGNRLIAKFKGWFEEEGGLEGTWYEIQGCGKYVAFSTYKETYRDLPFHRSWNDLMPVVEQIEALNTSPEEKDRMTNYTEFYSVTIYGKICRIGSVAGYASSVMVCEGKGETKIEAVWNAVINFIKWYNKKNKITS
jgi:hypothetical protein